MVHDFIRVLRAVDVEEHRVVKHGEMLGALQSHHRHLCDTLLSSQITCLKYRNFHTRLHRLCAEDAVHAVAFTIGTARIDLEVVTLEKFRRSCT